MPIPPDTRAPGDSGHVTDHNQISDELTTLAAAAAAETARATTAEALLAPLASPALTGTPTAPTKSALTSNTDVATTAYADSAVGVETSRATTAEALLAPKANPTFTGTVTVPTTVGATDAAQKQYVDSVASGLNAKPSVKVAATGSITLSGTQTIDGVAVAATDRVLATGQGTGSQNGVWVVAAGAWTRPADFASSSSQLGTYVFVEGGTVNGSSGWVLTGTAAVTVDTTAQTWTQFSGAGEITAGTGLGKAGNTLSLTTPVAIASGGTGQATAPNALNALGGAAVAGDIGGTSASPQVTATHLASALPVAQGGTASASRVWAGLLTPTAVKTFANSPYGAAAGDFVPVDTTSGNVTVTLPNAPADLAVVAVKQVIQGGTNTVTIACGGSDVFNTAGGTATKTLTLASQAILLQYKATGGIWYVTADDLPLSQLDARYAQAANNLSDLGSKPAARDNLGAFKIVHAIADFGAYGDNTHDDTTALQNFFTAIATGGSKAGFKGYLPPGTYKITSALVGGTHTQCAGGGKYVTTILQTTNNQDVLQFTGSSGAAMLGVELSDFSLQGTGKASGSTGVGLSLNYWLDTCSLKRMIISQNGSHGVLLQNSYLISFEHVWYYSNGGDGLHAATSLNAVKWDNCEFWGNAGAGADINGTSGSIITACDFETNGQHGLKLTNAYSFTVEANDFENNGTSSPGTTYSAIYVASNSTYSGPRIVGNNLTGTSGVTANGIEIAAAVTATYLEGNSFNNFALNDILINSGAKGVVIGPGSVHQAGSGAFVTDSGVNTSYLGNRIISGAVALTDASTIAVDASLGNVFRVTLGGNRTLGNPTNPVNGQKILIEATQPASGGPWALSYGGNYAFSTDLPSPVLSTAANAVDYLKFIYNATAGKWRLIGLVQGF